MHKTVFRCQGEKRKVGINRKKESDIEGKTEEKRQEVWGEQKRECYQGTCSCGKETPSEMLG